MNENPQVVKGESLMGHNGGPSLYLREIGKLQVIEAVLKNPRFNQTEALVLIGLIVRSNAEYADAFPGAATLALYAKVKRTDTVFQALRKLEDHFALIERKSRGHGRSNSYTIIPQRVVDAIVDEYTARRTARALPAPTTPTHPVEAGECVKEPTPFNRVSLEGRPVEPGEFAQEPTRLKRASSEEQPTRLERVSSASHPVEAGATHPVEPGTIHSLSTPVKNYREESNAEEAPPRNRLELVDWSTALNPGVAADTEDVFWIDGLKIEVMNGFKVELQQTFPNVNLIDGLSIVAGETPSNVKGTELKKRILRKFGYLNNDERGKDRRAAALRKPSKSSKPSRW